MPLIKSFDSESINYHLFRHDPNSGEYLIIIPGFGGDINFYNDALNLIKQQKPHLNLVVTFLRGHGFSTKNFPDVSAHITQIHAQDLLALIKKLRPKKLYLVGHSFGGVILQDYLNIDQSIKPEKFFLFCSTTKMLGIKVFSQIAYQILANWPKQTKPFSHQTPNFYKRFGSSWDLDFKRWLHDCSVVGGVIPWLAHFIAMSAWENKFIKNLDLESGYYFYGKQDIIVPKLIQLANLKNLNKINKIELNCGHLPPITHTKIFATSIINNIK